LIALYHCLFYFEVEVNSFRSFRLKSDLDDTTNRWITREEKFRKKALELETETRKLRNAARKESIKVEDDELDK
jgi:hypothetical protein